MIRRLCAALAVLLSCAPLHAETLRIATYHIEYLKDGPGLALRDIRRGQDDQLAAISQVIAQTNPDILALQGLDYDAGLETLTAFNDQLAQPYAHMFARPTNRGLQTGLDMDGNGRSGEASDAQGFGRFYGQGAMALLSRVPIDQTGVQDFTELLWVDAPDAQLPRHADGTLFPSAEAAQIQRLSSSGHWIVPLVVSANRRVQIMVFHASPPVFDGSEDRNGLRNAAEIDLWRAILDGALGPVPTTPFVIAGSATLDPFDSDGRNQVIRDLLADPRLQDPAPQSDGAAQAEGQGHIGPDALDTVDWDGVGRLRVDYVLPSADLRVTGSGVFWPPAGTPGHDAALSASRHRLVWVDITLPD